MKLHIDSNGYMTCDMTKDQYQPKPLMSHLSYSSGLGWVGHKLSILTDAQKSHFLDENDGIN